MKYICRGLMLSLFEINHTDNIFYLYSNISYRVKSIGLSLANQVKFSAPLLPLPRENCSANH